MQMLYKNHRLEHWLIVTNIVAATLVIASFVSLFGFDKPLLPLSALYGTQLLLLGRLGPLTLLAALTFDLKPVKYNYPEIESAQRWAYKLIAPGVIFKTLS